MIPTTGSRTQQSLQMPPLGPGLHVQVMKKIDECRRDRMNQTTPDFRWRIIFSHILEWSSILPWIPEKTAEQHNKQKKRVKYFTICVRFCIWRHMSRATSSAVQIDAYSSAISSFILCKPDVYLFLCIIFSLVQPPIAAEMAGKWYPSNPSRMSKR